MLRHPKRWVDGLYWLARFARWTLRLRSGQAPECARPSMIFLAFEVLGVAGGLFFFLRFANQSGVPGFRIDHGGRGQTTAGYRVGIFLLDYYTVFDAFRRGWRQLAPYRGWGGRDWLLLRRATGEKQAQYKSKFPHALCFRSRAGACRWQSWLPWRCGHLPVGYCRSTFMFRLWARKAQVSANSSISLVMDFPAPWPALVSMRIRIGDGPA